MKIRIIGAVVTTLGALALAGCQSPAIGSGSAAGSSSTLAPYTRGTGLPAPTTSSAAPTTPANTPAAFGQTKIYTDGIAVTVTAPQPYTPSASAAGVQAGESAFVVTITITNGTSGNFDPAVVRVSAQGGGVEASEIFDSAKN